MLPFTHYPGGGRILLGSGSSGDSSCRRGYGLAVLRHWGPKCAYCDRNLAESYEAWLNLSVDHVVPRSADVGLPDPRWIDDLANKVTCCRACNEFLNRFQVTSGPVNDLESFFALRDSVFGQKREMAQQRHGAERRWYEEWRAIDHAA